MIIDTSALLAVVLNEPERVAMITALSFARRRRMAAPNWLEACLVIDGRANIHASARLSGVLGQLNIEVASFDAAMAERARMAYQRFGKGRHPAKLNFGDCIAYAFAQHENEPLLFKGNDFSQTDIQPARF